MGNFGNLTPVENPHILTRRHSDTPVSSDPALQVSALFYEMESLTGAVEALVKDGFENKQFATFIARRGNLLDDTLKQGSKVVEGMAIGAIIGTVLGTLFGLLASVGFFTIPGVMPVNNAAPAIAAAAACGMAGGSLGGIIGLGFSEYKSANYDTNLGDGSIVLQIAAVDRKQVTLARTIIAAYGGLNIPEKTNEQAA